MTFLRQRKVQHDINNLALQKICRQRTGSPIMKWWEYWIYEIKDSILKEEARGTRDCKPCYNHFHNIFRLFDVLPNFSFTTSQTMRNYYLWTCYIRAASRVTEWLKTYDLKKLGNIRKVSKLHRMIA